MYDILIVGGGHAGVEAAYISSQFKSLKIGIVTLKNVGLASAPCNPSIGGVGKGQVVREIDALGGLMGKLADMSGIQFRTLNESKGYAVQSTRIQIDKIKYSENATNIISKIDNIDIVYGKVSSVNKDGDIFVIKTENAKLLSKKVIMTVGTFLNGKLHTGSKTWAGGRDGSEPTDSLDQIFGKIKTVSQRFKTGTPARLDKNTIDYSRMEEQPSDSSVETFHVLHGTNDRFIDQKSCYLAYTNPETMKIIRDNKEKSPMFNGQINAVGARYCPSIEDKAFRYPDKDKHHVFIEPESHNLDTMYPSGISSSLPADVQDQMMKSISGLENVKILQYGYAVEYDVVDTTRLNYTLEHKDIQNLYFAGQVNGTSGYEEAGGQGLIAGANAALSLLGKDPLVLSRKTSYIGVMIEDLISNTRDEPYRLFTARSENRLFIREDNVINRMSVFREQFGLNTQLDFYIRDYMGDYNNLLAFIKNTYISSGDDFLKQFNYSVPRRTSLSEFIKQNTVNEINVLKNLVEYFGMSINYRVLKAVAISNKYDGYINKASSVNIKYEKLDKLKINWSELINSENISFECKQRIERIKPQTFGQLKLIEGIRPATLAAVAGRA